MVSKGKPLLNISQPTSQPGRERRDSSTDCLPLWSSGGEQPRDKPTGRDSDEHGPSDQNSTERPFSAPNLEPILAQTKSGAYAFQGLCPFLSVTKHQLVSLPLCAVVHARPEIQITGNTVYRLRHFGFRLDSALGPSLLGAPPLFSPCFLGSDTRRHRLPRLSTTSPPPPSNTLFTIHIFFTFDHFPSSADHIFAISTQGHRGHFANSDSPTITLQLQHLDHRVSDIPTLPTMREVNFSIPNVNKASVGITTALYDRRALDCTSTLPLINSLNHLAYLTTSSARIRDILTVDGGIERLVTILKRGRTKDMMDMWKWNLAFQCVVNIGVRGTENVRTRVVEADMVPVIATILDNYLKVIEKCREKAEEAKDKEKENRHRSLEPRSSPKAPSFANRPSRFEPEQRTFRRQAPPPSIDVSAPYAGPSSAAAVDGQDGDLTPTPMAPRLTQAERFGLTSHLHQSHTHNHHHHHQQPHFPHFARAVESRHSVASASRPMMQPLTAATPPLAPTEAVDAFGRPVHDAVDRLASMFGPVGLTSQPTSPTTPLPPSHARFPSIHQNIVASPPSRRRPSIRHQNSTQDSDDLIGDDAQSDESPDAEISDRADEQAAVDIQDITMEESNAMLPGSATIELSPPTVSETQDTGAFNITHRVGSVDLTIPNNTAPPPVPQMGFSPNRPTMMPPTQPSMPNASVPRYLLDRHFVPNAQIIACMPREEDVLMSLQLLAYVSKYCGLRSYFQNSHLVPRLKIGKQLRYLDGDESVLDEPDEEKMEEEFLLPNDFNIFPLVEKFTVRHHSPDMQYWAGVVMRNLCRKDDTRGGIRQCAYYKCGKWEEYTRQFAKCRRCRRTKYCSKECQKSAWAFHRHWCVAASP
ncbi:hypothetical protein SODALDRAFT_376621 [Sodiomyces alkalinus F11]|uniref:MYND-type zinc finger protein samB n=1 Tax=Sodiomyces alkalinus (strain CBS 110278 / VKM F-3762 / F11) TaxID=1314773 RepID=A0A3N2Q2A5_SODAK|nr:hypothetical protein SODALDRAFT_376621 [Sodiomyces alkalinus F11]ROT40877.1 hypothetical protein SODALDRAFT_376621 [Sodiomyces alkalinus F11]